MKVAADRTDEADASISERLAEWIFRQTPDAVPGLAMDKSGAILLDIVGLCFAASRTDYVTAALSAVEPGDQVIIAQDLTASPSSAALVNGVAAHGEDFDDTFEGGPVHSGVVVVPAVLAAAQSERLPAERIMLAIAVGAEVTCRLALVLPKAVHRAGFHPTAVLGVFGATAGICAACGTSPRESANALGIAGSMASGIIEYLGDGSWTKRLHPGWSAQAALRAVSLARGGFVGPRRVFEGEHGVFKAFAPSITPRTEKLFEGLGERFVMEAITLKPYPCGTMVQPYIDCAIDLRARGASLEGIARIVCRTAEGIVHRLWEPLGLKQRPPTAYAAKFSLPYGVALGLVRGHADLADFAEAAIVDPQLIDVADRVTYEVDPQNPYPDTFTGHVRIEYADGRIEEAVRSHMRGGVDEPLSRSEIEAKYRANLAFGGHSDADRVLVAVRAIAAGEGDYRLITRLAR